MEKSNKEEEWKKLIADYRSSGITAPALNPFSVQYCNISKCA